MGTHWKGPVCRFGCWLSGALLLVAVSGAGCLARPVTEGGPAGQGESASAAPAGQDSPKENGHSSNPGTPDPLPTEGTHPPLDETREAEAVYFYLLGQMMLRENRWMVAEESFSRVARLDPDALDARLMAAHLAVQRGDLRKAAQYAREVVEFNPQLIKARVLLGAVYAATNRFEEAVEQYEAILQMEPENDNARLFLAQAYGRLKRLDDAKKTLTPLFHKSSGASWKAQLAMGRILTEQDRLEEALSHFRQARILAPDELEPVLTLGAALQELNRTKEVESLYRDYLTSHPENMAVHSQLGRLLLSLEEREAALKEFRAITRLAPDSIQARLMAALILMSQERYEDALKDLRLAEALQGGNPTIHFYLAQVLDALDRGDEAIDYYRKIEPSQPWYVESQMRLALREATRGQANEAISRLQELLKQNAQRSELYLALSFLLLQEKQYEQVVQVSTRGLGNNPDLHRLRFNRAMALDKLGRWSEAEADLLLFLQANPNDAQALNYLGYTWAERRENLAQAHEMLVKAVQLAPGDGYIADSLGWVLFQMRRLDEALAMLRQAVRLVPDDPTITEHLGDVLWEMERRQEALDSWRRALQLDATNDTLREKVRRHELGH